MDDGSSQVSVAVFDLRLEESVLQMCKNIHSLAF